MRPRSYLLIRSKRTFFTTLLIATLTLLGVWFVGLRQDWSLFKDSLVAVSILAISLLSFLTAGLYFGVKLRDTLGSVTEHIKKLPMPDSLSNLNLGDGTVNAGHGEGCLEAVAEIFMWLIIALVAVFVLWIAAAVVWATFLTCTAILYWLFFRALRFVFRHSMECRGRLGLSLRYGLTYATLYVSWLYAIILAVHYLH
ncbi:hypothetical protein [Hymenobacter persicinus]|uniref:Uncharacterized protein n=1 Tax=Hymenobacter persicinus TaxID=2025506 RepID=A0A4Q5LE87_9BACT|nr:hypothetical protein [Hymenobacter persicinus]RYU80741.1 hypothetical protein EWM57_07760 [Hymenobacter persicinus]